MRLFVVCLLGLGVTVQGYASVRVMDAGCPMLHAAVAAVESGAHDHAGHAMMDHAGMHHGGMDHSGAAHDDGGHGKRCQSDVGCQSAGHAVSPTLVVVAEAFTMPGILAAPAPSFRSHTPPLLARPPALA